jgi:hypothetical protein
VLLTACADTPGADKGPDSKSPAPKSTSSPEVKKDPVAVAKVEPPARGATAVTGYPGLHNVVTYHEGIYVGAVPEGDAGFATLKGMGVRTILTVDGSVPEVEKAKEYGFRYVHLPTTYDGMSHERVMEIARAVEDLPGPIYIHCHHGKHRSAAAAGAACVTLGYLTPEEAEAKMKVSGTAPAYKGLWKSVEDAKKATPDELAATPHSFPEKTVPKGLVPMMVAIDEENESLKAIQKAGWKVPADQPDLVPVAVAGRIADHYRDLAADAQFASRPAQFHEWLLANQKNAETIEAELAKPAPDPKALETEMKALNDTCNQCHTKYRN